MQWEAVSAISTAFTGLVILLTVIVGVRQARAALDQIRESRQATQLDGMMRIFEQFDDERFVRARQYIMSELAERMKLPDFENYLRTTRGAELPWSYALLTLERMGVYVHTGLLDGDPFYYHTANTIILVWKCLRPLVELQRRVQDNPYLWKDTEYLAAEAANYARRFFAEHPRPRPSTGEPFNVDAFK